MPRKYTAHPPTKSQKNFVAKIIREARLARDLSVREATIQAGVSQSSFVRWETGDAQSSAVRILNWLFHDPTSSHDAFYWRERALLAERTIEHMHRDIETFMNSRDEILKDDAPTRNRQTVPRRTAEIARSNGTP